MMTEHTPTPRALLRRDMLHRRDAQTEAQRHEKSCAIARQAAALPLLQKAGTIFTYVNFRSEVETMDLIGTWLAAGKRVCVPLTLTAESRLTAYQITDPSQDLVPGYCQIPEPAARRLPLVRPADIEVIILPGGAFDLNGGRLGYGGGYYDRFISQEAPTAIRIGLAFELQVTTSLPLLAHDQRLHLLITEERILRFDREV